MWWYALGVIAWWLINPEIRRLIDWKVGFNNVSVISAIPLILLLPFWYDVLVRGGWRRLPLPMLVAAWCWAGAFVYAFSISVVVGRLLPGAYDFADFMLPLGMGLWVASRDEISPDAALEQVSRVVFVGATVLSIYGIIQYVIVPPWDAYWMQNAAIVSIGKPLPFQVRVFSTLNSAGPFGNFMFIALALVTPKLSFKRPWLLAQVAIWLGAFALSSDRSGWLAYAVALLVYFVLSPRRVAAMRAAVLMAVLAVGITLSLSAITGSTSATQSVVNRFSTFGDVGGDASSRDRQEQYASALAEFEQIPIGQGLGLISTAGKLGTSGAPGLLLDSGLFARLLEMGAIGGALFYIGLFIPLGCAIVEWLSAMQRRNVDSAASFAMIIGMLIAMLGLQLSGDNARALVGIFTWIFCAYAARGNASRLRLHGSSVVFSPR